jgi:hypothetical protein
MVNSKSKDTKNPKKFKVLSYRRQIIFIVFTNVNGSNCLFTNIY